eukprot:6205604-Pleurochrysis_carterae.AAC.1
MPCCPPRAGLASPPPSAYCTRGHLAAQHRSALVDAQPGLPPALPPPITGKTLISTPSTSFLLRYRVAGNILRTRVDHIAACQPVWIQALRSIAIPPNQPQQLVVGRGLTGGAAIFVGTVTPLGFAHCPRRHG